MDAKSTVQICSEIQDKRCEMINTASLYGLNHDHTLRLSQQLDQLINEYLVLQHQPHREVIEKRNDMVVVIPKAFYGDFAL